MEFKKYLILLSIGLAGCGTIFSGGSDVVQVEPGGLSVSIRAYPDNDTGGFLTLQFQPLFDSSAVLFIPLHGSAAWRQRDPNRVPVFHQKDSGLPDVVIFQDSDSLVNWGFQSGDFLSMASSSNYEPVPSTIQFNLKNWTRSVTLNFLVRVFPPQERPVDHSSLMNALTRRDQRYFLLTIKTENGVIRTEIGPSAYSR